MAGDWIKLESVTPDKPEVHRLAELLNIEPDAVLGKLCRVWIWADQQTTDGHALSVTRSLLDRITLRDGFASALLHPDVGWLVEDESGAVTFPHFERHNGATAKARALQNKRQKKHREASRDCHAAAVTESLPEKRREEKSIKTPQPPAEDVGSADAPEDKAPDMEPWNALNDPKNIASFIRILTTADPTAAQLAVWHACMADLARRHADPAKVASALHSFREDKPQYRGTLPEARRLTADWFLGLVTKYGPRQI